MASSLFGVKYLPLKNLFTFKRNVKHVIHRSSCWRKIHGVVRQLKRDIPSTIKILLFYSKSKDLTPNDNTKVPYAVAVLQVRKRSGQAEQREIQLDPNKAETSRLQKNVGAACLFYRLQYS